MHHQPVPWRRVLVVHLQAEVAQHLGGPAFADADVDGTAVETRLRGGQPRHRRQEGDAGVPASSGIGMRSGALPSDTRNGLQ